MLALAVVVLFILLLAPYPVPNSAVIHLGRKRKDPGILKNKINISRD